LSTLKNGATVLRIWPVLTNSTAKSMSVLITRSRSKWGTFDLYNKVKEKNISSEENITRDLIMKTSTNLSRLWMASNGCVVFKGLKKSIPWQAARYSMARILSTFFNIIQKQKRIEWDKRFFVSTWEKCDHLNEWMIETLWMSRKKIRERNRKWNVSWSRQTNEKEKNETLTTVSAFRAAQPPIETWSSFPALYYSHSVTGNHNQPLHLLSNCSLSLSLSLSFSQIVLSL
jgi:hypothetical protein